MRKTLGEIAKLVKGEVVGDKNIVVTGLCGIKEAQEGDLTFIANPKYFSLIGTTKASAILAPRSTEKTSKPLILVDNPSLAFTKILSACVDLPKSQKAGIHKTAIIDKTAKIGKGVFIGPHVIVEAKAKIGDHAAIHAGCFIGYDAAVGKDCLIYPRVTIRERVTIGNRVIIHSGTVVGSDGFGFIDVEGIHEKIPQIGTVIIEDDVEIGANAAIDRARFDKTLIGRGTKVDNLVHIAHNVIIGEHCLILAQVGISGSVTVEKKAILAGQAGLAGHLTIGEGAIVAAQAGVTKSVAAHTMVSGYPAKPHDEAKKVNAHLQRLPHYVETINELKKHIQALEAKIDQSGK
ncbi:MAG: UDP-3-O-(3-hydroxymyristoyl)glucosamine N-acyltransferase [Candidatus Omnitrophota bacterium]